MEEFPSKYLYMIIPDDNIDDYVLFIQLSKNFQQNVYMIIPDVNIDDYVLFLQLIIFPIYKRCLYMVIPDNIDDYVLFISLITFPVDDL